ncbi:hypothetical protein QTN47_19340 [Danxiaibacter flavus]|uniref:Uncharacterized protein n=1 Tax=Danxiaibacter flavus TaxID=3049108 RepID=A0ABV3ZIN1_9BACT|nr:hypothetical protein QNM32_19350 [Chitinophagaceae bacterium DXS]
MKDSAHAMKESGDTVTHGMNMHAPMSHAYSLNLPMNRNGSGTAWLPDASPMYGVMVHSKKWMYMIHGNIFLRYTSQDIGKKGSRGDDKFDAPNWFMLMAQRRVGKKGLFNYTVMLSLDPLTEGGAGYPLLFQTGESWNGKPLVDRQHPHDLFSGLSIGYTQALSKKSDLFFYFGYPGEPALGSVAFMHRPSSLSGPDAPITHHWNDGTHITFGVATIGYRYDKFKIEASSFTGREPDENRYNFDKPLFDSWSTRLSFNPSANWAMQVSHGFIKSPEALHSNEDINRTTASAITSYPLGNNSSFNATALWGLNKTKGHDGENAALLEASANISRTTFYMRYEWVQKSVEELNLDANIYGNHTRFPVNLLAVGASYNLLQTKFINVAAGGQLSFYHADKKLNDLYGMNPLSGQFFIHLFPPLMNISMHH